MLKVASDVEHARIWAKIESLDDHGSRGMGTLTTRMDGLIRDVADLKAEVKTDVGELKTEMGARFEIHEKVHEQDAQSRRDNRRWRITATAGAIATCVTVIALLITIIQSLH